MVRTILAVLVGLFVALLCLLAMQFVAQLLSPAPAGLVVVDEADLVRLIESEPIARKALTLASWMLSSFLGALVAAGLARTHRRGAAICVGALILAGVLLYVTTTPPPAWITVLGVLTPLPLAWLASRLVARRVDARHP